MEGRWWPAPAKINLFLHITGRRADGYHELQTVFQFIDLGDRLRFTPRTDGRILRLRGAEGVPEEDDLVVRAARILREETGCRAGVAIEVEKNIPQGGGLGGGSSDAATTLLLLNRIWGLGLGMDELARLGLRLGADVPVFVHGHAAWAEGVGERLQPLEPATPFYLLLHPGCEVATAGIFGAPELTRDTPPLKIADFLRGGGRNDCEPVVRARYPQVDEAMRWLEASGEPRLTGTGACIYAAFEEEHQARQVAARVPEQWRAWVVRGLNRSPLHELLESV
ncbi:MAG: 4-(cytidine 5'-diphospho)-2-C-methyl-D-erythritol kinase [Gammaproteobacteria bacterium]|nr:MAG: 4-(cytidine 5'-diphospho)-2-C-methyl-D-erythritol kinase [Gammaproteobacteria bacterium]